MGIFVYTVKSEVQYFETGCIVLQLPAAKNTVHFPLNYMSYLCQKSINHILGLFYTISPLFYMSMLMSIITMSSF